MKKIFMVLAFAFGCLAIFCARVPAQEPSEKSEDQKIAKGSDLLKDEVEDFTQYFRSLSKAPGEHDAGKIYMTIQDKMSDDLIPQGSGGSYPGTSSDSRSSSSDNSSSGISSPNSASNNSPGPLNLRSGEQPLYSGNQNNGSSSSSNNNNKNTVTLQPTVIRAQK